MHLFRENKHDEVKTLLETENRSFREKFDVLKNYLFGSVDRTYSFVSVALSVISVILTAFLWKFPEKIPYLIIIRDIIVVFGILLGFGLLLYKYIKREAYLNRLTMHLEESNKSLNQQFSNYHLIVHKFRNDLFDLYLSKIPKEIMFSDKEKKAFEKVCHSVTTEVKRIMGDYIKSRGYSLPELCVTVKLTLNSDIIKEVYGAYLSKNILKKTPSEATMGNYSL